MQLILYLAHITCLGVAHQAVLRNTCNCYWLNNSHRLLLCSPMPVALLFLVSQHQCLFVNALTTVKTAVHFAQVYVAFCIGNHILHFNINHVFNRRQSKLYAHQ